MKIDGKAIANTYIAEIEQKVARRPRPPHLVCLLIGDHLPSRTYVSAKRRVAESIGIGVLVEEFPDSILTERLQEVIERHNRDSDVDAILVQFPLPSHVDKMAILEAIDPNKDVDGFHPINAGKLAIGDMSGFIPCTPLGVVALLDASHVDIAGKEAVVIGRSTIVGKPLALLLAARDATVTLAHSKSSDLTSITRRADILCSAVGSPRLIGPDHVKEGAVVIDIGITRDGKRLTGDVDYDAVSPLCSAITPVPGGVGPMTIAMLMANTLQAAEGR